MQVLCKTHLDDLLALCPTSLSPTRYLDAFSDLMIRAIEKRTGETVDMGWTQPLCCSNVDDKEWAVLKDRHIELMFASLRKDPKLPEA